MNHDNFAWSVAENTNKENPFLIRFAELKSEFKRADYPHRLNVFWALRNPAPNGLPSKQDHEETGIFEERLIQAFETEGHSILPMILTGGGQKEYVVQTSDPQLFLSALTNIPQEEERYPIEINHLEDEVWEYFDRVLSDVSREQAEPDAPDNGDKSPSLS